MVRRISGGKWSREIRWTTAAVVVLAVSKPTSESELLETSPAKEAHIY